MLKKLLLTLCLMLVATSAMGQITKIQNAIDAANNAVSAVTVSALGSGNMVIANVSWCDNIGCNASISGETVAVTATGCTFEEAASAEWSGSLYVAKVFVANNCSSGATTITSTITGGSDTYYHQIAVSEWSDVADSNPVDQVNSDTDTEGTAPDISTDSATTQNEELVYAQAACKNAAITAIGSGYTAINGNFEIYKTVSSTGVQTADWTIDGDVECAKMIVTFKEQVSGGGTTRRNTLTLLGVQ